MEGAYTIKLNRRDGSIEIVGDDKEWVAAQLDKAEVLLAAPAALMPTSSSTSASSSEQDGDNGGSAPTRGRAKTKAGGGAKVSSGKSTLVEERLTTEMHGKLEEWVAERKDHFESKQDQAAIVAGFLEDVLGFDGIDQTDLISVYETMGWRKPVNMRAVINNARDRQAYFRGWVGGRARLSVTGQNFARHDAKKPKPSKATN